MAYASANAAVASVRWRCSINVSAADARRMGPKLRNKARRYMILAGAKSPRFGRVACKPGYNLPENIVTTTIQATGSQP